MAIRIRRKHYIGFIVILAFAGIMVIPVSRRSQTYVGTLLLSAIYQTIDYEIEQTKRARYIRPVTLERQASVIVKALNKYYERHKEYPQQIYGDVSTKEAIQAGISDPLLSEGFLSRYPKFLSRYLGDTEADPRGSTFIRNVVSSPDDSLVRFYRESYKGRLSHMLSQLDTENLAQALVDYPNSARLINALKTIQVVGDRKPDMELERPRLMCGGGADLVKWQDENQGQRFEGQKKDEPMSLFVFPTYLIIRYGLGLPISDNNDPAGQFGYQREDFIEAAKGGTNEAWLWFYGFKGNQGLDLVTNDVGLIQPDGIPDGIVLLYKLKDGQVTEVVKKYD